LYVVISNCDLDLILYYDHSSPSVFYSDISSSVDIISVETEVSVWDVTFSLLLSGQLLLVRAHNVLLDWLESVHDRIFSGLQSCGDSFIVWLTRFRSFILDNDFGCLSEDWEILNVDFVLALPAGLTVGSEKFGILLLLSKLGTRTAGNVTL